MALGGVKPRAVLALLVLHAGEAVSAERLALALWGEEAPAGAVKTVQVHVSRLRKALGDSDGDIVETTPAGYRLRVHPGGLDAQRFAELVEQGRLALGAGQAEDAAAVLREALALWRGPPLADLALESFAHAEVARLEEQRLSALELRVEAELAAGWHAALIGGLQQLAAANPTRERLTGQLMLALYRCGRQADALDAYQRIRTHLADTLGLQPQPELRDLERAILTHSPQLAPPATGATEVGVAPIPPFPLLGREREFERLRSLVDRAPGRLVTVVGPGGVGKTRLVTELARQLMARRETAWVALAPLSSDVGVAPAIAHSLSTSERAVEPTRGALTRALVARELLLVLDNFEHVLGAAPLIADLLASAPRLAVLITSREPLHLRAEHVFVLAPLAVGAPGDTARSPAVALFLATAKARRPDLEFTPADMEAVSSICRRVDGLPLAIELAAGRLGLLSPRELGAQVRAGLDALGEGPRDAPERQRTLRDTLAWSHRLLSAPEREAFARFAVFAGGATLTAARTVTGAQFTTLEALTDKHLLTVAGDGDGDGGRRLDMLHTIRQFARERLGQRPDAEAIGRQHAEYYLGLAEGSAPELRRHGSRRLFRSLDREVHNLRAAMTWALAHDEPEVCVRIAVALEEYWPREGPVDAARWLTAGIEAAGERLAAPLLARALVTLADQLSVTATIAEAEVVARRAVEVARATKDPETTAAALIGLAWALVMRFRETEAYPLANEAVTLARATGDRELAADAWAVLATCAPDIEAAREAAAPAIRHFEAADNANRLLDLYDGLAYLALALHDDDAAREFHERAKTAAKHSPVAREVAWVHHNEGLLELMSGNLAGARAAFARQVTVAYRQAIEELFPEGLYGLAVVVAGEGDDECAARLYGLAEQLLGSEGVHPAIRERLEPRYLDPARRRLGLTHWEIERAKGRGLDAAAAIALAGIDLLADGQIERVTS